VAQARAQRHLTPGARGALGALVQRQQLEGGQVALGASHPVHGGEAAAAQHRLHHVSANAGADRQRSGFGQIQGALIARGTGRWAAGNGRGVDMEPTSQDLNVAGQLMPVLHRRSFRHHASPRAGSV